MYKARQFDYENGKRRLAALEYVADHCENMTFATPGDDDPFLSYEAQLGPGYTARTGRVLRLSTIVDFDSRLSIGCASAILDYLQACRLQVYIPGDRRAEQMLRITSVEMFNLNNVMYLNSDRKLSVQ